MNDQSNSTIDTQIKELLARAVAAAPPPPDLDHPMSMKPVDRHSSSRNPWIVAGGIGLAAAATVVGLLILPSASDETTVLAPSDTALPEVAPPGSVLPEVNPSASVLPDLETPSSTAPDSPATETTPVGSTSGSSPIVVSAGPAGVEVLSLDGVAQTVTTDASRFAVRGPDGRIYFEPAVPDDATSPDTRPRAIDIATGEVTIIDVPNETSQLIALMDVADVNGELTILYSVTYTSCTSGSDPACLTTLHTFQPASGATQLVAERNAWEFGWQPFTLATNGIVAGAGYESVVQEPTFYNVGTGIAPTLAALGLDDGYADCADCPTAFAVDDVGAHVAWIEGASSDRRIVITELSTGARVDTAATDADRPGYLQLAGVAIVDGAIASGQAVFTPFSENGDAAPVLVDLARGDQQPLAAGTIASLS